MQNLLHRLRLEPVVVRTGLAAVLTFLVAAGVIDTGASEAIETAVTAVLDAVLILTAREKVTPVEAPAA